MAFTTPPKHAYFFDDPANRGKDAMRNLDIPASDFSNVTFSSVDQFGLSTAAEIPAAANSFIAIKPQAPAGEGIFILLFVRLPNGPDALLVDAQTDSSSPGNLSLGFANFSSGSSSNPLSLPFAFNIFTGFNQIAMVGVFLADAEGRGGMAGYNFSHPSAISDPIRSVDYALPDDGWSGLAAAGGSLLIGVDSDQNDNLSDYHLLGVLVWDQISSESQVETLALEAINNGQGLTFPIGAETPLSRGRNRNRQRI